jgi:hypothetical protein
MTASTIPFRITDRYQVEEVVGKTRGGRCCVRLISPLEYRVGHADSAEAIIVPAGFETDFASIPWGLWNLFPPWGPHARPAIIHDFLYAREGYLPEEQVPPPLYRYTRKDADRVFLEAMQVVGVPAWRRSMMFRAVRLGGGKGWGS